MYVFILKHGAATLPCAWSCMDVDIRVSSKAIDPGNKTNKKTFKCFGPRLLDNSEIPLASFSKRDFMPILSYENKLSFTCKLNSFLCKMVMCTRPRFQRKTFCPLTGKSEMGYYEFQISTSHRHEEQTAKLFWYRAVFN